MRTYCKKCNKHTEQTVRQERGGRRGTGLVKGTRMKNRHSKGAGNKGKYSKKAISQSKMAAKTSTKVDLRLTCDECKSTRVKAYPRARKVEIIKTT